MCYVSVHRNTAGTYAPLVYRRFSLELHLNRSEGTIMKYLFTALALGYLALALPRTVKADEFDGQPFKFTNTGSYITGEPLTGYTATGTPAMATVQVGTSANFT